MEASHPLRHEVEDFLYHEAELVDSGRFGEWLELMTDDVRYEMPVRMTRERGGAPDVSDEAQFFWDDRATLQLRVDRLRTEFAWAEDPPSRTRHFVANVRVRPAERPDEVEARSYVLITRSRGDGARYDLLAGERRDRLRRVDGAWRLARRAFVVDQVVLGTRNLSIFV